MSIDPKFVELTADVLEIFLYHRTNTGATRHNNRGKSLKRGQNSAYLTRVTMVE